MRIPATARVGATADRLRTLGERVQGRYRVPEVLPRLSILIVAVLGAIALAEELLVLRKALDAPNFGLLARDFGLYMDATHRWLGGGSFYEPFQLAGPYDQPWGQIYYPPQALALFVPFTVLGAVPFILIPTVVTAAVIWAYRPRLWAWAAILAVLVLHPDAPLPWIAGTPTIWVIALVALATRWPWVSAFIWFKPSVFPFALIGIRDRRWWIVSSVFALSAIALLPMMRDWVIVVMNARGENSGLLYSLSPAALAGPLIPVIAWLGRQRELLPGRAALRARVGEPADSPAASPTSAARAPRGRSSWRSPSSPRSGSGTEHHS
jgi:hypothetical protein